MRVFAAFVLATITAALIGAAAFSPIEFRYAVAMILYIAFPVALVAGIPFWLVSRRPQIRSPWVFAAAGATLALVTYLLLAYAGMGAPSEQPMTFAENISRPFHLPRIAASMLAGAGGASVFWAIAIAKPPNSPPAI